VLVNRSTSVRGDGPAPCKHNHLDSSHPTRV
jgi:hypothetical protein